MFHLREGFYFGRNEDGSVTIRVEGPVPLSSPVDGGLAHPPEPMPVQQITVPPNEWASVLASVCRLGESSDTYQAAVDFHGRAAVVAPVTRPKAT